MIKFNVLLFMSILLVSSAFGQLVNVPGTGNEVIRIRKYTDVEGSPYLYSDWKSGTVTDHKGKVYPNVLIKYDAYEDVVEINQEGTIMLLSNELYPGFTISFAETSTNNVVNHLFKSGFNQVPGHSKKIYFEVLKEGLISVIKKYDVKFIEEVVNKYGSATAVKQFQRSDKYFIIKDGVALEIKLTKKSIMSAMSDERVELEKFVSKEKLKLKNESDLLRLVDYYEGLNK